jgi:hypothetical protein
VLQPSENTYAFFLKKIEKQYKGDPLTLGERIPHSALVKAVLRIRDPQDAERFMAGLCHWFQVRRPRKNEEAFQAAQGNIAWCFDLEEMDSAVIEMWKALWVPDPEPSYASLNPFED